MNKRILINIVGRVQGVGFRVYTVAEAETLGLKGFVQNEKDGSVTIVAEGEEEQLKKFVEWAKHGPRGSYVKTMRFRWDKYQKEFKDFDIRYL